VPRFSQPVVAPAPKTLLPLLSVLKIPFRVFSSYRAFFGARTGEKSAPQVPYRSTWGHSG
jgi:hypothetical protein